MAGNDSVFTQAIEDHLALKKQNAHLEPMLPIGRFSDEVGDPLDRYPGGPVGASTVAGEIEVDVDVDVQPSTPVAEAPASELAEPAGAAPVHLTPSLSLVDDLDRNNALNDTAEAARQLAERFAEQQTAEGGDVVRFPGGAGPREETAAETVTGMDVATVVEATDEPATEDVSDGDDWSAPAIADSDEDVILVDHAEPFELQRPEPIDPEQGRKRRWFGVGRKRKDEVATGPVSDGGWFSDSPRGFSWDD